MRSPLRTHDDAVFLANRGSGLSNTRQFAFAAAAFLCAAGCSSNNSTTDQSPPPSEHPVTWTLTVVPSPQPASPPRALTLTATIPTGYHIYAISQPATGPLPLVIRLDPRGSARLAGPITATPPTMADDPNFGIRTQTYTGSATFTLPLGPGTVTDDVIPPTAIVSYEACTDRICLPLRSDTVFASGSAPQLHHDSTNAALTQSARSTAAPVSPPGSTLSSTTSLLLPQPAGLDTPSGDTTTQSFILFLWLAATMGALSLVTPCVFPMVPITVAYFSPRPGTRRADALRDALLYAAGIIGAFTGVGLALAAIFGLAQVSRFAANPWVNLATALLFIAFAFTLLGAFTPTLPSRFLTWLDALGRSSSLRRNATTLLMGGAFAFTSFTCTAPFVGTLLVTATQGNWRWPAAGLFVYSAVFALPFVALALAPHALSLIPKSGEWLKTLEGSLAFIEIAAAMKFLSNADLVEGWGIITRPFVLATWVVVGVALAAYLAGLRPRARRDATSPTPDSPHRASNRAPVRYLIPAAAVLAITLWIATGLRGHPLGELDAFLPPATSATVASVNGEVPWIVDDLATASARARDEHKLLLIDFTGYTCTNCRWMEANMFPRAAVRASLERFIRVRLFTDGESLADRDQASLEERTFKTSALPLYAIVDPTGRPVSTFLGMTRDTDRFLRFLDASPR